MNIEDKYIDLKKEVDYLCKKHNNNYYALKPSHYDVYDVPSKRYCEKMILKLKKDIFEIKKVINDTREYNHFYRKSNDSKPIKYRSNKFCLHREEEKLRDYYHWLDINLKTFLRLHRCSNNHFRNILLILVLLCILFMMYIL